MKKSKLTLGLLTALLSVGALAACNEVTESDGDILQYTDAQGNVTKITTKQIFGDQRSSSVASTDFDKVYEVLIRNYYTSGAGKTYLPELQLLAQKDVQDIKDQATKNADTNGTTYQEEFSKLLTTNGVDNVQQLYEAKLFEEEKKKFESDYETNSMIEEMRDGGSVYKGSTTYGLGSDGYLVEQMPYTISHILVKLSEASNGEHAQATITESESRKLGQVIQLLAGQGKTAATRTEFGMIAKQNSEDTGSAEKYGQLDVMDRSQADSFINEFKFGIYAYEAIFNQVNQNPALNPYAANSVAHGNSGKTYQLLSKIKFSDDATYTDASNATAGEGESADRAAEGEHLIKNYFAGQKIGRIPYGVALALAREDVSKNQFFEEGTTTQMSWEVNGGSATFYPRNILFNKYFNNHRVAVIVPNEIAYNDPTIAHPEGLDGNYATEDFVGVVNDTYKALPGFSTYDTTDVLPASVLGQNTNVLTTERGQVILVVRGGSSGSYEGIHFMVIDRSALVQYASGANMISEATYTANKSTSDVNSLQEFYTIYRPGENNFPTYSATAGTKAEAKTTYINQLHSTSASYNENVRTLKEKIKGYNSTKNTYMFQKLIEDGQIEYGSSDIAQNVKSLIEAWIKSQRNKGVIDSQESFDKAWATYVEYLTAQDEARAVNAKGTQRLISETCAIGYNRRRSDKNSADYGSYEWSNGGACYAK